MNNPFRSRRPTSGIVAPLVACMCVATSLLAQDTRVARTLSGLNALLVDAAVSQVTPVFGVSNDSVFTLTSPWDSVIPIATRFVNPRDAGPVTGRIVKPPPQREAPDSRWKVTIACREARACVTVRTPSDSIVARVTRIRVVAWRDSDAHEKLIPLIHTRLGDLRAPPR